VLRLVLWGLAATAAGLVHSRLWATPNLGLFATIAERLGERPFGEEPGADYLLTNLSMPALARALGQVRPHEYARLHLVVLSIGLVWCIALAYRRFGYRTARNLIVLCAAAPATTVALQWLGQPDALTLPLGLALVLLRRWWAVAAAAVVLGLTHPEQAAFIAVIAGVVRWAVPKDDTAQPTGVGRVDFLGLAAAVGGVLVGRALTELYLRINDISILRPRSEFVGLPAATFVDHHLSEPAALVYLLLGPLWFVVLAVAVDRFRGGSYPAAVTRAWLVLAGLSVLALLPVAVTLDQTRVYSMLTAPVLAGAAITISRDRPCRVDRWRPHAAVLLGLVVIVPGGFTAGASTWSHHLPAGEFVPFLLDGSTPTDLDQWLMSPFRFAIPLPEEN
jgi:hypothetical protein